MPEKDQGLIGALLRPSAVLACLGTVKVDQSQGTVAVLVWFALFLDSDFHVLLLLCSENVYSEHTEQEGAKRIKLSANKWNKYIYKTMD